MIIFGGGVAGLEALLALRQLAREQVDVELVAPVSDFTYRPMAVAEPFGLGESPTFDLEGICVDQGAGFHLGSLGHVDAEDKTVVTAEGDRIAYDVLLVAVGGRSASALPGSITVYGPGYTARFRTLLREISKHHCRKLTFAVPPGVAWPLPLYELALLTAKRFPDRSRRGIEFRFVTPEAVPLEVFGSRASEEALTLMDERGIEFLPDRQPSRVEEDVLAVVPARHGPVPADRVVSLPHISGPAVRGLPQSGDGFIPVDSHCRVTGHSNVFAAGDATAFAIKQGGIATQQAVAAAESIAADAGAAVKPTGFRPVLRGLLLTGESPRYMRAEVSGGRGEDWAVSEEALWWPPTKIAGRYLPSYLAAHQELLRPERAAVATTPR